LWTWYSHGLESFFGLLHPIAYQSVWLWDPEYWSVLVQLGSLQEKILLGIRILDPTNYCKIAEPAPGSGLSTLVYSGIPFTYSYSFLRRYDMEAIYFDEGVRSSKRQQLESKLLQVSSFF